MLDKVAQRQQIQSRRASLSIQQVQTWSAAISDRVLALPEVQAASSIFIYLSVGNEVQTLTLAGQLLAMGKIVAVPVVAQPGVMQACRIKSLLELSPDRYGIPSPRDASQVEDWPEVCLAPAVAVTEEGNRLGMGGGYYDRWLAAHRAAMPIALCYEMQIVPELATEPASAETKMTLDRVFAILEKMPTKERIPFTLRYLEGMQLTDVADASGVSLSSVKRHLTRATKRFASLAKRDPLLRSWIDSSPRFKDVDT